MTTREYLSFLVDGEEYAVPILEVREVRGWSQVRIVPNAPAYWVGVLDIRGEYVPIVDLRMRFQLPPALICATTVVVVLSDTGNRPLGLIVDGVAEVYGLTPEQIKPAPMMSLPGSQSFIKGIAAVNHGHLILIDIESLFDVTALNRKLTETEIM